MEDNEKADFENLETAPIQQNDSLTVDQQPFVTSETEWAALKALLDKRYTEIATLLRHNKTKDESIQRLSAEVQKYREGFAFSALKPFINALISFREDCRKSVRDAKQFALDEEKAKKYIEYLVSDFEDLLSNIGLERNDNSISINGKPLSGELQQNAMSGNPLGGDQVNNDSLESLTSIENINNISELVQYLNKSESAIRNAIQDKSLIDKTIQEYIVLTARTDAEHYLALAAPVSRQLYSLYDYISKKSQDVDTSSADEYVNIYNTLLDEIINKIEVILTNAGMIIESLDDVFDTQKHKLLKTIPTNDEKLDRTIANKYSDCYSYDGKIIYQSKVDVYKFQ